jgi:type 1 glutamine amidotransferase
MFIAIGAQATAADDAPKRLLLISQGPDGHPKATHEYVAGQMVLAKCLSGVHGLEIVQTRADGDWAEGPELLRKADGAVLFVSEGAKWLSADERRLQAFTELAARGGGLSVLHWGMGTKTAEPIDAFVKLFGACHGGPDRKYKFAEISVEVAAKKHPIVAGIDGFTLKEEFYYALKRASDDQRLISLLDANIDGTKQMVCWAFEREDGGRAFGFTGCHYHDNWRRTDYRRLISQGVLWTLKITPPDRDFPAVVAEEDYQLK